MKKKLSGFLVAAFIASVIVACGGANSTPACASPLTPAAWEKPSPPSGGGGKTGGGGTKTPSGGSKTPSGGGKTTPKPAPPKSGTKLSPSSAPKPKVTTSGTGANRTTTVTPPGEKAYTPPSPKVKPSTQDFSKAQTSAPQSVTTTGGYTSPVNNHLYLYHQPDYFMTAVYLSALDLYDPYDPYNYYYRPFSPFYGRPYMVGQDCGGTSEEFKPSQADFDLISAKLDTVTAKLDAGTPPEQLDSLDAEGAVQPTATSVTSTTAAN